MLNLNPAPPRPISRYLTMAEALEALSNEILVAKGENYRNRAGSYSMVAATLASGGLAGSDDEIAVQIEGYADNFERRRTEGIPTDTDCDALRDIAKLLRRGDLIGPTVDAKAAEWHREQEAYWSDIGVNGGAHVNGQFDKSVYDKLAAKMETHRVSACHFDGYEAQYRFDR